MITSFQVTEANALLAAYYKLYLSYYSVTWQLIQVGFTAHEAGLLCKHVDRGNIPPFTKPQIHEILRLDHTNDS